jgi:glycosyltransferase involved in cell wall biosynthesis
MTTTPKKVVFILPSLASGGAERVLITLMNRIDRSRFKPEFISLRRNGPLKPLINNDVPIHQVGSYRNVFLSFIPLLKKLRKTKPDVIITTMAKMNFLLLVIRPFLPKETRLIIREAITPSFIFETNKLGWLAKIFYKILYPKADLVISPAQRIIDEFETILDADTAHHKLLYNSVNIDLTRQHPLATITDKQARSRTVHFICAGRMHPQKGFDQLISALPYFKCDYDWHLTILGGGSERKKLDALVEKHSLQNKVSFPGYTKIPWSDIAAADCFLLPSRYEGLPNVVLESLSVGTPVIATKSSGGIDEIKSVSEKNSVLVVETMPDFIDAMQKFKPNPTEDYRTSLLPDEFRTKTVIDRFMDMLDGNNEFNKEETKSKKLRIVKTDKAA